MKDDLELKLQAYVDGELSGDDARDIEKRLAEDSESRLLVNNLQGLRGILKANQPEVPLPVAGTFFWSQIERQIAARPSHSIHHILNRLWLRWLFPAGLTALLAIGFLQFSNNNAGRMMADEIETSLEDATFISFRSQSDGFSVVWVDTQAGRGMAAYDNDDDEDIFY